MHLTRIQLKIEDKRGTSVQLSVTWLIQVTTHAQRTRGSARVVEREFSSINTTAVVQFFISTT